MSLVMLQQMRDHQSRDQFHERMLTQGVLRRPKIVIAADQLCMLVEHKFGVPKIANMLGVSVSTVRRRMSDCGLSFDATYAELSDEEVDLLVSGIQYRHPMCGNQQMQGHLLASGYRIQQHCIPYNPVNRRNSLLGACQIISAYFLPAFYPR